MIFTSTTRESVARPASMFADPWNHNGPVRPDDDSAYVWPSGTRSMFSQGDGNPLRYDPRPEFRAPTNLILVDFRKDALEYGLFVALDFDWVSRHEFYGTANGEQIDHARKVLARLVALND